MNITELDSYRLADAVKFHNRLNPALWGQDEHLLPDVRDKLAEIAADFQEFLGVPDLDIKDITISGSNAAYNYTPNSDIDLHLVIDLPEADISEVYRELFDAKKFQYNETHNITIGGYDVELYVQNPNQEHHSQGIYSLLHNDWISVPRRKKANIDDISTRSKYQDLAARIDDAVGTGNYERMSELMKKIRAMRQSGLQQQGEFGADNLAFKLLRNNGYIKRLVDARDAARDLELSLAELARPQQRVQYGFMNESPDGVSASTKMFLDESDVPSVLSRFFDSSVDFLDIENAPTMVLHNNTDWSENTGSFGQFDPDANVLHLATSGRHVLDILRTMAHELTHCRQNEQYTLPDDAGETGSAYEDQANAMAGRIMRHWADKHPAMFKDVALEESASGYIPKNKKEAGDPRYSMALTVDVKPGQTGREANKLNLHTDSQGRPALLIKNLKNALREFKETGQLAEQDLFEINMSPTNLKKLAAQTGALAGMEFEMIVPGIDGGGDDGDLEPDYDQDERCRSIEDAAQFFFDGDFNGRRDIQRLRDSMQNDFQEWLDDKIYQEWESRGEEYLEEWIPNNVDESEWNPDNLEGEARTGALEEFIANLHADPGGSDAFDEFREESNYDESDWLDAEDLDRMSDVERQYEISWPYWSSGGGDEGAGIESVADEFRDAIGRKVNWSDSYHGGKREDDTYVVEPDGSLIPGDSDDAGLEFVSPPLPIDEMISDLNKVKAWADQRGCYTSKAAKTGLHINVSVPGFDNKKLDYVKLALLLGDEYVLNQFGRLGNSYAASAMGIIKERIAQRPEDAAAMLQKMKTGLGELASKVVHSGTTSKFTSINTKDGYIEFRSPGGDWLGDNFDKIETTLMRFVVALDAAMNPEKYRDEYLKKLYTVLKPKDQNDTLSYFAKFAAGELPKAALKSFIKQAQLERKDKKNTGDSAYTAIPSSGNQKYQVQRTANDEIVGTFNAASDTDANAVARQWMADNALQRVDFRLNRATGQERAELSTAAPTPVPGIIDIEPDVEQNFVPGSTLDLQRQRQQAAQQSATANALSQAAWPSPWQQTWAIKDSQGKTLHTFSGIGNSQADANRVAAGWLARAGYQQGLEVEVVPVMEPS